MDPCHGDRAIAPCVFDTKNGSFTVAIRCKCKGFRLTTSIENRTSVEAVPDPSGTRS